jgi:hypothetical protein
MLLLLMLLQGGGGYVTIGTVAPNEPNVRPPDDTCEYGAALDADTDRGKPNRI